MLNRVQAKRLAKRGIVTEAVAQVGAGGYMLYLLDAKKRIRGVVRPHQPPGKPPVPRFFRGADAVIKFVGDLEINEVAFRNLEQLGMTDQRPLPLGNRVLSMT